MATCTYTLEALKDGIEKMDKHNQIEVLKILNAFDPTDVMLNENSNGTYINLSSVSANVIAKLSGYLAYIEKQESILGNVEAQKEEYKKLLRNGGKN